MSRLSDQIQKAIDIHVGKDGRLDLHAAIETVCSGLDFSKIESLGKLEIGRRLKAAMERGAASARTKAETRQYSLPFDLKDAHALDDEGRKIVLTRSLLRSEFERVIEIRQRQIVADSAYLKRLQDALLAATPIWDRHPDWTFGQVCEALSLAPV